MARKAYPTDVRADEWAFVAPYLPLMTEDAPPRDQSGRAGLHGLRWIVRAGAAWRLRPPALPPWHTVSPPSQRWLTAGVCAPMVPERRAVLRRAAGRPAAPSAALVESRTLPSTSERGTRAGEDGAKRRRGSPVPLAVDILGPLAAAHVTAANEQDRSQDRALAEKVQEVTGDAVAIACVDQGYPGPRAAQEAEAHQMHLEVGKRSEAKKGLVLLPKRWGVERRHAWAARFRRLARDDERWAEMLAGLHCVAFAIVMLKRCVALRG